MSTPVFDKNKPYGDVFGHQHIRYSQNGHSFRADGSYIPDDSAEITAEKMTGPEKAKAREAQRKALMAAFKEEIRNGTPVTVAEAPVKAEKILAENFKFVDAPEPAEDVDYESLHWTKLKELAEERGLEYKGKKETIKLLRGE